MNLKLCRCGCKKTDHHSAYDYGTNGGGCSNCLWSDCQNFIAAHPCNKCGKLVFDSNGDCLHRLHYACMKQQTDAEYKAELDAEYEAKGVVRRS